MHPILFHLGHVAVSTQGIFVALGLLVGVELAYKLAPQLGLDPERIWNLGLISLLTLFVGERLLVIAFHLRDSLDHPLWMIGLATLRDTRYFYGGALLATFAGAGYIAAWRLPWRRVLDCLAPGAGVALACASLGAFASGSSFGRASSWGVAYTSRLAQRTYGTPLGVSLAPIALYAALLHLVFALSAGWLALRGRSAAAAWLFAEGLSTVLLGQLRYRLPDEPLVAGVFTPAQAVGVLAVCLAAALWLRSDAVAARAG